MAVRRIDPLLLITADVTKNGDASLVSLGSFTGKVASKRISEVSNGLIAQVNARIRLDSISKTLEAASKDRRNEPEQLMIREDLARSAPHIE
jgi:hypothetical protein